MNRFEECLLLASAEIAPEPDRQSGNAERSDAHAGELVDRDAGKIHHAADDVVHPLMERDRQDRSITGFAQEPELVRNDPLAFDFDTTAHSLDHPDVGAFRRVDVVLLFESEAGVHDPVGEFSVIREEQQAFGLPVEAADGIESFPGVDEIHHRAAVAFVTRGGDVAARLVQHDVASTLRFDDFAIDANDVAIRIGFGAEFGDRFTIDRYAAGQNHLFRNAARGDAPGGENALQALHSVGFLDARACITQGRKARWRVGELVVPPLA